MALTLPNGSWQSVDPDQEGFHAGIYHDKIIID